MTRPRTTTNALMTGDEYLESLRDGRAVHVDGERVKDVTRHPAFRNAARSIARLYDALHAPDTAGVLTGVDPDTGIRTHRFFKPSRSASDLVQAREAIAAWARMGYGFLGRTPEYKAAFMAGLGVSADYYGPFAANATAWYQRFRARRCTSTTSSSTHRSTASAPSTTWGTSSCTRCARRTPGWWSAGRRCLPPARR
ncbi:4-hydroxyphenylacetate 3-hydroxylase N-terminal domain-containing protein [Streptomyces sp. ME19-01-6]|nr:4-hydroxyphenylacetate 3-hydroxylase N-terminal domain-containing protein [Streptomyces sp. ME19-01-6]MDX3225378.1 4-hydroxyphenylacetate 3-hydroxylase N-terminal domain-containing protein [Streptomyces sp. ME19-01-6]